VSFGFVPPPFSHALWERVADMLEPSVERFGSDWGELQCSLADYTAQLWVEGVAGEPVAAMVTRMDGDTLEVWLAGGAVLRALSHLETAIEASRSRGATNGRIAGRKGWQRALKPYGWRQDGDDLVKRWA
jgi:hypothetical protein